MNYAISHIKRKELNDTEIFSNLKYFAIVKTLFKSVTSKIFFVFRFFFKMNHALFLEIHTEKIASVIHIKILREI